MHTTAVTSRDFGGFRQQLLLAFGRIIDEHDAKLAMPTQVRGAKSPQQASRAPLTLDFLLRVFQPYRALFLGQCLEAGEVGAVQPASEAVEQASDAGS